MDNNDQKSQPAGEASPAFGCSVTCGTCKHWHPERGYPDIDEKVGECRCRSPIHIIESGDYRGFARWANTLESESCGEHTPNPARSGLSADAQGSDCAKGAKDG